MKLFLKYYGLTILWALFVFTLCTIKLGPISESPRFFPGFDKLVHCGFFFTLIVLFCNGAIRQQKPGKFTYTRALIILVVCVFYGGLIEILQLLVFTWRDGDWNDLFSDALGACMGIFSVMITLGATGNEKK